LIQNSVKLTVVVIRLTAFATAFTGQLVMTVMTVELSKLLPALALL
jgi:hypothetical protein